jgi:hypothetical protein
MLGRVDPSWITAGNSKDPLERPSGSRKAYDDAMITLPVVCRHLPLIEYVLIDLSVFSL